MKLISLLLFTLLFSATTQAEIIDIDSISKSKLKDILEEIDVKIKVSNLEVKKEHEAKLRPHISKYVTLIFMPGNWETHDSCSLNKNGNQFECTIEDTDMTNVLSSPAFNNYYQFSVHVPVGKSYCNDVNYYKDDLKIEKEGFLFPKYTLIIEMDECSFQK